MGFRTISSDATYRETIKGSVFEGFATRVASRAEAESRLAALREAHGDASHVCFAYRVGAELRFSDDGEPGGTAGRPILEVIQRRDLDHVLVAVVRWFGGTLLGAGGLVRAYRGTAAATLDRAGEREVLNTSAFTVRAPFASMDAVLRLLAGDRMVRADAPIFTDKGMEVQVTVAADEADALRRALADVTRGEAEYVEPS